MERSGTRRRMLLGLAIGVPVSLLFGVLAFRNTDPAEIGDALRQASWPQLVAAVAMFGVMYTLQATRWRIIAATPQVSLRTFLGMVVGGIAVNDVLPGRIGDLLRARWLGLEARIPSGRAFATVVLDRSGDVIALTALLGLSVLHVDVPTWLRGVGIGAVLVVLGIVAGVLVARAYTARHPRARRERGRFRRIVRDVLDGLSEPLGARRVVVALALSFAAWLSFACAALLVADSLGVQLGFGGAVLLTSVVNLGVAIPSSPGFVGTYQWLIVETVGLLDVTTREQALALSILLHAVWYVPTTLVGGIVVLLRIGRYRSARAGGRADAPPA